MTPSPHPDLVTIYDEHYQFIHAIFTSRLKMQILLTLYSGSCSLSKLRDITGSTSQALIPKIRALESLLLVEMKNDYELTPFGRIVASRVANYVLLMGGIEKYREFWEAHDMSGLPPRFLEQIGDLYNSEVKLDNQVDIMSVYSNFLKILKEGKYIHGISSVMSPGIAELLTERIMSGTEVELVVSDDLVPKLNKDPYTAFMRQVGTKKNFRVYSTSDTLRVGITVTDRMLSLGLFKRERSLYDSSTDLFSDDIRAVKWGERLFQYYRGRALQVDFSSFFE